MTRDVVQLNPALLETIVATLSAWYATSAALHGPGTTITGVMFPSSALKGLWSRGSSRSLRSWPSGPAP